MFEIFIESARLIFESINSPFSFEIVPAFLLSSTILERGNGSLLLFKITPWIVVWANSKDGKSKSTDWVNFISVNTQPATGSNGSSARYYQSDTHAGAGSNFYRFRNVNHDGNAAYSKVVKVDMTGSDGKIVVYPNPSMGNTIGLQFSNMPPGKYRLKVLNTLGQALLIKEITHAGGTLLEKLKLSSYMVREYITLK